MKAGVNQKNWLAKISYYIANRKEMEDSKSIPMGSPIGQNKLPVPIGSQTYVKGVGQKSGLCTATFSDLL
jgi:hypothetical protein